HKLKGKKNLANFGSDLNYFIVRPAIVYGLDDRNGLTPRIIIGSIYRYIRQRMQGLLNNKHLNIDGTRIESTGFTYNYPTLELSSMKETFGITGIKAILSGPAICN
ncbi:hypothetical protein RRG08_037580, partial [Elysia crispata]